MRRRRRSHREETEGRSHREETEGRRNRRRVSGDKEKGGRGTWRAKGKKKKIKNGSFAVFHGFYPYLVSSQTQ